MTTPDLLTHAPEFPQHSDIELALSRFEQVVRASYGDKVDNIYLVGSRARGDHRPDSDADLAVVFRDSGWSLAGRVFELGELAYDMLIDQHVEIQSHPVSLETWLDPTADPFVRQIKRDARRLFQP